MDAARSISVNTVSANAWRADTAQAASRRLTAQDASVRTEIARKAAAASISGHTVATDFTYALGPDGQLYVASGKVSATRKVSARELTGTRTFPAPAQPEPPAQEAARAPAATARLSDFQPPQLSISSLAFAQLQEAGNDTYATSRLAHIDASVRSHERQHFFAAGGLADGIPVYEYAQGPDGQYYAIGGHVNVSTTPTADSEKAARDTAALARAATAPADTSAQDINAAGSFASKAARSYAQSAFLGLENMLDLAA